LNRRKRVQGKSPSNQRWRKLKQLKQVMPSQHPLEVSMRTSPYYKRASKRFLAGTRFKTPCDAVGAGARTLHEWTQVLEEERSIELQKMAQRAQAHVPNHKRVARAARI
jgi:hypothetical protein